MVLDISVSNIKISIFSGKHHKHLANISFQEVIKIQNGYPYVELRLKFQLLETI